MNNSEHLISEAPRLAIVLPCFNESESIENAVTQLTALIQEWLYVEYSG